MNVDDAMEIADSSNFAAEWYDGSLIEAVGVLRKEVERLRAACNKYSEDELLQGDWKARALKAETELAAAKAEREDIQRDNAWRKKEWPL